MKKLLGHAAIAAALLLVIAKIVTDQRAAFEARAPLKAPDSAKNYPAVPSGAGVTYSSGGGQPSGEMLLISSEQDIWTQPRNVRELHFTAEMIDPGGRLLRHLPARVYRMGSFEALILVAGIDWAQTSESRRNELLRRLVNHLDRNGWRGDCRIVDRQGAILWRRRG